MSMSKILMVLVVAAMVVAGLSMVGGDGREIVAQDAPKDAPEGLKPEAKAAERLPVVVRRGLSDRPKTLDPHLAGDVVSSTHVGMTYEQLFEYDYFVRPMRVVPCLAASMPTVSEDGLTWTIKTREGVKFQDEACFPEGKGRVMTASDVVWSIKRMAAHPSATGFWLFEGKIVGLDEFNQTAEAIADQMDGLKRSEVELLVAKAADRPVEGIKALDATTVKFTLTAPYPQLIYALCFNYTAVVPHEAVRHYTDTFASHPVGTGPFVLAGGTLPAEPTIIAWERSPSYRDVRFPSPRGPVKIGDALVPESVFAPHVGKRLPLADRVEYLIESDKDSAWEVFESGGIDIDNWGLARFEFDGKQAESMDVIRELGLSLYVAEGTGVQYLSFCLTDSKFGLSGGKKADAMRKAVCLSLDQQEYCRSVLLGRGFPLRSWLPPAFPDNDPDYACPWTAGDAAKGRELLKSAGFSLSTPDDGMTWKATDDEGMQPSLEVLISGGHLRCEALSRFLGASGKKIGIQITTRMVEVSELIRGLNSDKVQAYVLGWDKSDPHAQGVLRVFTSLDESTSRFNFSKWKSPEANEVYKAIMALSVLDQEQASKSRQLCTKFMQLMDQDCPAVPLALAGRRIARHSWVLPIVPNDFNYCLQKYAYSDPAIRTAWLANMEARKTKKPADPDGK